MFPDIFFQGWNGPLRILIIGPLAYVALIAILRLTGKRTLSKLNAFDLVITVALGSVLATIILNKETPLAEGLTAIVILVLLQLAVTWTSVRRPDLRRLVRAQPAVLLAGGRLRPETMRHERVTEDEVLQAVRDAGADDFADADAVFLQSDGSLAVVLAEA
ncbi:MAG: DUF421 domain-containing protein [Brevundimonas sp.]